ncbi:MAG TPA: cytochrome ubiquinol oxidase subunit I [Geminicoccaceae bacterium]
MSFDPIFLSRLQFAFTIAFHILFPAFTIGLAAYIAVLEGLWLTTRRRAYLALSEFWTRLFAISFGMGVVSGIVMSYQVGTNWSRFSDLTGNVLGPLFTYEVLSAFFLEASFLGILLFGRGRVPEWVHALAAVAVAGGTLLSMFWILSANSWMHTPAGFVMNGERFEVADWWAAVLNPSFPYRLLHMGTACFLTTAFVVAGVSAWFLLRGREIETSEVALRQGIGLIVVLAPLQILLGDLHGLNTLEHQPAKVAAMEGHWESQRGAPMVLFAWPDVDAETNRFEVAIPKLASLILTHELDGRVRGLTEWPEDERPYVPLVFFAFRIMVAVGFVMLAMGLLGLVLLLRRRLGETDWFLRLAVLTSPIGFIAILAGWVTTEVGRQPWVVYGHLRTADGVTPSLDAGTVLTSLALYMLAYGMIFGFGLIYMLRVIQGGPEAILGDRGEAEPTLGMPGQPVRAGDD